MQKYIGIYREFPKKFESSYFCELEAQLTSLYRRKVKSPVISQESSYRMEKHGYTLEEPSYMPVERGYIGRVTN